MDKLKRGDFQACYLCNSSTRILDVRDVLILLCFWIRKVLWEPPTVNRAQANHKLATSQC
jgi:hypothetical protein